MSISEKAIKILWSNAAGRCSFPDCPEQLAFARSGDFAPHTLGEMAHICGEKPNSNPIVPREWFLAPLFVIDEAIERIKDGSITEYQYNTSAASFVKRA